MRPGCRSNFHGAWDNIFMGGLHHSSTRPNAISERTVVWAPLIMFPSHCPLWYRAMKWMWTDHCIAQIILGSIYWEMLRLKGQFNELEKWNTLPSFTHPRIVPNLHDFSFGYTSIYNIIFLCSTLENHTSLEWHKGVNNDRILELSPLIP